MLPVQDQMLEPQDGLASSSTPLSSSLRGCTPVLPDSASTNSDGLASAPSAIRLQAVPSSSKARRNKAKRAKWEEKLRLQGVENKSLKKREESASRLAARLARTQRTIASPFTVSSLPKNQSGFAGSLRSADKEEVVRLQNDLDYFREIVRSLRPVPYE